MLRRVAVLFAALAGVALAPVAVAGASPADADVACDADWGTGDRDVWGGAAEGALTGVRSGQHECFDRLVLDLGAADAAGFHVGYRDELGHIAKDQVLPLRGDGVLVVLVDVPGQGYQPANPVEVVDVTGYRTFQQVRWAGSAEGQVKLGIGTPAGLPFRVTSGGGKLVVDVAHS
ncbi:AMIN-like domain-containing (lipo)protein [Actinosynnema sp.]|uniref:AMIN-like domain-containing (lipo)protein n=1 Tax=Actinosynnema sp. TaxID=1872144 RepID=UPI003F84FCE2